MGTSLTVDIFISVDGWAGSEDLPPYFGYPGPELAGWIQAELERPQVVVMGRKTYEALAAVPVEFRDDSWDRMTGLDKIVFSRTLERVEWDNTKICDRGLVDEVRRLKTETSIPLRSMGSVSLVRQLCNAGLVDRLRLMIFPLLAGPSGRQPFFEDLAATDLHLAGHHTLDQRIVLLEYSPAS